MFDTFDFSSQLLIFIGLGLVTAVLFKYVSHARNLPPGPCGLPIVGYLPFLTKNPHLKFWDLSLKYGKIFSLRLGSRLVIVLNDGRVIREAFGKPESLGRPQLPYILLSKSHSPFFLNGDVWREHRRFTVRCLKDLGMGKSKMHDHVQVELQRRNHGLSPIRTSTELLKHQKSLTDSDALKLPDCLTILAEEIKHLLQRMREEDGKPLELKTFLTLSISNNICSLVFGKRCDYNDPERNITNEIVQEVVEKNAQTNVLTFSPMIMRILKKVVEYGKPPFPKTAKMQMYIRQKITEHAETVDDNDCRDYIDSYLTELKNQKENDIKSTFSDLKLAGAVQQLFVAGSETVGTTIVWCFSILAVYPEVQEKVRKEIHDNIRDRRLPNFSDYKNTPYTISVIQEVMRWRTAVPINILRETLDRMEISGFTIPKGTILMANIWAAHHNPNVWKAPENFVPDRFLSSDGKTVLKDENFMPFSFGKRACLAEGFAMLEVYLHVTSILQYFNVSVPNGSQLNLDGTLGITYYINPQKLVFTSNE